MFLGLQKLAGSCDLSQMSLGSTSSVESVPSEQPFSNLYITHTDSTLCFLDMIHSNLNDLLRAYSQVKAAKARKKTQTKQLELWHNVIAVFDRLLLILFLVGVTGITFWFTTTAP